MKRLGIIGGLGPETSSNFCLNINRKFIKITNIQPNIQLENLPVPKKVEKEIINGKNSKKMLKLLEKGVINLQNTDFIVIPCNTVHIFIKKLRLKSKKPILSIIEETAKKCNKLNFKKVGLIATEKTVKERLFFKELRKFNIDLVLPSRKEQNKINKIIIRIIDNKTTKKDKEFLLRVISRLKVESIILGCTDLHLFISEKDCNLPLLDSCKTLEDSVVERLIE